MDPIKSGRVTMPFTWPAKRVHFERKGQVRPWSTWPAAWLKTVAAEGAGVVGQFTGIGIQAVTATVGLFERT